MHGDLFARALGVSAPWFVEGVDFNEKEKQLVVRIDFKRGSRFAHGDDGGAHPVHDTQVKLYRHLGFFQHDCLLEVRVPRIRLEDRRVALVKPPWAGRLSGFTLLFEALVLAMCREMPFAAVARLTGVSWHRVRAICKRYVDLALEQDDLSRLRHVAIDETSRARGHNYVTAVADTERRRLVFLAEGRKSGAVREFAEHLAKHGGAADSISRATIDMSAAFIKGVAECLPNAELTHDKFHVLALASKAVDETRRIEQRLDPALKGLRWTLLKNRDSLTPAQRADLDALLAQVASKRTARAWLYRDQLRDILNRKQINVVTDMLHQWCTNVNRSKVEPMKKVARTIRKHQEGIAAWARTRETNGFLEALNGLFQAAKRKARGYKRFDTILIAFFLVAGKLDFRNVNPHAA